MWLSVKIEYGDETCLILEDQTKVTGVKNIIKALGGQYDPSLSKRLSNARKAAVKIIDHAVKTGEVKAPEDVIKHRRKICSTCPYNQKKLLGDTCMQCGCNISSKTTFLTESCPEFKW